MREITLTLPDDLAAELQEAADRNDRTIEGEIRHRARRPVMVERPTIVPVPYPAPSRPDRYPWITWSGDIAAG